MSDEPQLVYNTATETGVMFRIAHKKEHIVYVLKGKEVEPDVLVAYLTEELRQLKADNKKLRLELAED